MERRFWRMTRDFADFLTGIFLVRYYFYIDFLYLTGFENLSGYYKKNLAIADEIFALCLKYGLDD